MADSGKVSNTVPIILLVVGILLIIGGGAMIGIYAHEEFDKKNAQTHHFYLIAGGAVLLLVGFGMGIFGLIKMYKNNKINKTLISSEEVEAMAATPDASPHPETNPMDYRGMNSIPSPPRPPPNYYPPASPYGYQPAPPSQPTPYGMMPGYPGIVPGGYDYGSMSI